LVDNPDETIDTTLQQSGRYSNLSGGPGGLKEKTTVDPNAIETEDPVYTTEGTSSRGGGKCTYDYALGAGENSPPENLNQEGKECSMLLLA